MSITTTGAELKSFLADTAFWPDGAYYDDVAFTLNGVLLEDGAMDEGVLAASDKISIEGGWVYALADGSDRDFEAHFEAWRQRHSTRTLLVQVDASKLDAVLAAIVAAGGSVAAGQ